MTYVDFNSKLKTEYDDTSAPELRAIMRNLFPDASGMKRITSLNAQRAGLDVQIFYDDVARVGPTIDFKFRETLWPDFALEYEHVHDDGSVTSGWVCDENKRSDFIGYVFKHPIWLCYLIPFFALRSAWEYSGEVWIDIYRNPTKHRTRNKTYWTNWCPVPKTELMHVMGGIRIADQLLAD